MTIRFGSVCSGIEAASVAWGPLGWEAAWLSEIEPFPCALLAHYYPNVPNLGDMTTIKDRILRGEVEAPDVFCGGTPCFTAGHLVLTETGYKPIESIQVGEKVITHKGRLRPVLRVGHKQAKVGVLKMIGHKPIVCTPNHKFYSVYWKRYITGAKNVVVKTTEPEWVEAEKLAGRQWTANINYESIPMSIESAKFVNDDKRAMLFIGMYLGDGYIRRFSEKNKKDIVLCLNDKKLTFFKENFDDITATITKERSVYKVAVHDTKLADFIIKEFGEYSHAKRIPAWVLSHPYRSKLLKGYLETDGYKLDKGGYRITTVSPALAYGVTDLFNSLGYVASAGFVKMPKTCVIEGRVCNQRDMYQVRAYPKEISVKSHHLHGYLCRKVQSYTLLDKEDTVYNIEVDEDHSYCVGGMIAHNCQAWSFAGLRKSLSDNRAVLSLHFVEIANAIDSVRSIQGKRPVTVFWENVPGVLSTQDNAFGCFLAALVGGDIPATTGAGRWPDAGFLVGPQRIAAWRILDAQHFGLAQRRRRVFVVASARDKGGVDPAEILFERPGVQGDFSESRAQGQGSASGTVGSAPSDDSGPVQTLVAGYSKSYNSLQELDKLQISAFRESSFGGYEQDKVSSTLKAVGGVLSGGSETFVTQKDNTPPQRVTKESSEH